MDNIHPIDRLLGANLRKARFMRDITQQQLGQMVEPAITFQQIQKYEKGINRISSNYLWRFSKALNCPLLDFYDRSEELLSGQEVKIEMPDKNEADIIICYRKMPLALKHHISNLVHDLAESMTELTRVSKRKA